MTAWIKHEPGPCPIPDAKAGEWEYQTIGGSIPAIANWDAIGYEWEEITQYRLIKPAVEWQAIADGLAGALGRSDANMRRVMDRAPVRDLAETYAETESALAKYQKAKGIS
jgi:hypothetical protein